MAFQLFFTKSASNDFDLLEKNQSLIKRLKAVRKALGYLETNPRHPSLNTHKCTPRLSKYRFLKTAWTL